MDHPKLTPSQSAVLFVLMAESRELSTPELRKLGPDLDKPSRTRLQKHGLIESRKGSRNALYHSLTDDGWAWCATELQDGPPNKALPPVRALYAVLAGIGRYLDAEDLRLFEVFGRPRVDDSAPEEMTAQPADVGQRIIAAYQALAPTPGALVGVAQLRAKILDADRVQFDTAIVELQDRAGISLIPQEDQARLTDADRSSAVVVGSQPCHLFAIEEA